MRHTSVAECGREVAASPAPLPSSPLLPASPLLAILLTAAAYGITGRLGVLLAIPPGFATAVWPPSGIALAATLVWGARVWPGIVLGSFLVNIPTAFDASTTAALCTSVLRPAAIGVGAALQAVVGAALIRRYVGFPHPLDQERAVGAFLVLGGPLSCLINATIGMTTLLVSGLIPWPMAFLSWWTWWVGDASGVLIVTPLVLIWTAEPRHVWRQRRLSMAVPLTLVFGLATVFFVYAHTRERTRFQVAFERQANPLAQAIQSRLHTYLDLLHTLESLYATTPEVTRPAFGIFVQHFLTRYPGLQALSWDRRVPDTDRSAYEAAMQQEGYSDFHITAPNAQGQLVQAAQRPEYVVVTYIEPAAGNASVLGFDVASDPVRRMALQQAQDTGLPAATGQLTLVQQRTRPLGVLIFQPIYRYGQPHTTVQERRQHLQGYVTAVFWMNDMVEAALQGYDRTAMALQIDDLTDPADPHLLYRHPGWEPVATYTAGHDDAGVPRVQWTTTVELAGRRWRLQFTPTLAYLALQQTWPRWVTLTGGFLFTGVVGAFLLVVTGHMAHVEQLVVERTTELAHTNAALAREQEALRQQREWLEVTLASIGDAVLATDTRGRITLLNPAAAVLTGWTAHEALERPIDEVFRLIHQPTRQPVESPVSRLLREAFPVAVAPQTVLLTRQGGEIAIATSSAPIRDRAGQLQGVVVVCRDISEQRQEELLRAQKIASVGVLAGGIAHDFNNLLTGILGNISLAKMFAGADARLAPCLSEAEQACQQATALTRQLLTFSKGGAPVRHTVALGDCLHESTVFALRGSNVRSDLAIATDLWPVEADVGQLHQVIHNVVRNAAQAMPHGGTVQVRAENMVVHPGGILPLAEGRYLKITVTDQGGGIPADILPKIFDPYFTTKARGNGLGLATTYAIVTKHDGYIHAASEVGVGTTFFIYLPASSQAPASAPASRTEVTAGSGRILVMDDDAVIRKLLAVMLPSLGYEVTGVPDGAAAVEAYHQAQLNGHAFAAVILDITIPGGMGGVDTLHQLRALDPQVKALLSSGYADDAVMATYAQYGFAGVIPKPYAVAQVHDALHRLLGTGQTAPSS